jgi:hypothetical protein
VRRPQQLLHLLLQPAGVCRQVVLRATAGGEAQQQLLLLLLLRQHGRLLLFRGRLTRYLIVKSSPQLKAVMRVMVMLSLPAPRGAVQRQQLQQRQGHGPLHLGL